MNKDNTVTSSPGKKIQDILVTTWDGHKSYPIHSSPILQECFDFMYLSYF